jgi:regulation of enolase protein 1 (concanavalin A-like superfamily)
MMMIGCFLVATVMSFQGVGSGSGWVAFTSREGNFVVDFPGRPQKNFVRQARTRNGMVKVVVVQCDTPDVLYTAEKIELPQATGLKAADMEAILDYWRDSLANDFNGKVVTQKRLRLESGAYGRDFTVEGRPDPKAGLATIRVREYLAQKLLYILVASTAADKELPDDVGHFFASFSPGTRRTKRVGPHPEPDGKPLGTWGMAIDPDGDCQILDKGTALEISVPNTHHDLNADNDKLNAPRVMREVTGDFTMTVKVIGTFKPGTKSTNPKAVPYIGAGIVVWQDSDNYVFLGRAAINRNGKISEFAAFEEREWGSRGALNNRGIDPGGVYLRLERRNNRLLGYTSKDGRSWSRLDPMEPTYPSTLKVGLYAINGCTEPISVQFDNFQFTEGAATPKAKAKARRR